MAWKNLVWIFCWLSSLLELVLLIFTAHNFYLPTICALNSPISIPTPMQIKSNLKTFARAFTNFPLLLIPNGKWKLKRNQIKISPLFPALFVLRAFSLLCIMLIAKKVERMKNFHLWKQRNIKHEAKQKFNCVSLSVLLPRRFNVIKCTAVVFEDSQGLENFWGWNLLVESSLKEQLNSNPLHWASKLP
jgi:hypothetical protein